ncbi:S-layer homology domain-containing protein [Paenibacillus sp. SN-8-1]|uniref:S-layer homology domain-containing protein n=1 Tax=Paenibacillus sp. SN-8-1 TaxID=3435409 RepID=UPI003D9A9F14
MRVIVVCAVLITSVGLEVFVPPARAATATWTGPITNLPHYGSGSWYRAGYGTLNGTQQWVAMQQLGGKTGISQDGVNWQSVTTTASTCTYMRSIVYTREQAMVIIAKAMELTKLKDGLPAQDAETLLQPYADAVYASDWAISSIVDSIQSGVITGRSQTELAPNAYITRAEIAVIIQKLLQKSGLI